MPVGLATGGWPWGCRTRPLLSASPRGGPAAPWGLGTRERGLLLRAANTLPRPSEPPLLLAPLSGQGEALSTTPRSHDPRRRLLRAGGRVWAVQPPRLLCGHAGRDDGLRDGDQGAPPGSQEP